MLTIDPIWSPDIQQQHFRLLLDAMARPGLVKELRALPQSGISAIALLATLVDNEVSLADPDGLLSDLDASMLQARFVPVAQADFIVCDGRRTPNIDPRLGTLTDPDQSATLFLMLDELNRGDISMLLKGPGIDGSRQLSVAGLHPHWLSVRDDWVAAFPLGVDMILFDAKRFTALPRTTHVKVS